MLMQTLQMYAVHLDGEPKWLEQIALLLVNLVAARICTGFIDFVLTHSGETSSYANRNSIEWFQICVCVCAVWICSARQLFYCKQSINFPERNVSFGPHCLQSAQTHTHTHLRMGRTCGADELRIIFHNVEDKSTSSPTQSGPMNFLWLHNPSIPPVCISQLTLPRVCFAQVSRKQIEILRRAFEPQVSQYHLFMCINSHLDSPHRYIIFNLQCMMLIQSPHSATSNQLQIRIYIQCISKFDSVISKFQLPIEIHVVTFLFPSAKRGDITSRWSQQFDCSYSGLLIVLLMARYEMNYTHKTAHAKALCISCGTE